MPRQLQILSILCTLSIIAFGATPANAARGLIVANGLGRTLSAMNLETGEIANDIAVVGQSPNDIAIQGEYAYVVNSLSHDITVVSLRSMEVVRKFPLVSGSNPYDMEFVDKNVAYITNAVTNTVSVVNTDKGDIREEIEVGLFPEGLLIANGHALVANSGFNSKTYQYEQGTVSIIDINTHQVFETLEVPRNPQKIALGPDGRIYVLCTGDFGFATPSIRGNIVVLEHRLTFAEGPSYAAIDTIAIGHDPSDITFAREKAYVLGGGWDANIGGIMDVFNHETGEIIVAGDEFLPVGAGPTSFVSDETSGRLFVSAFSEDAIQEINPATGAVIANFPVGDGPGAMAVFHISDLNLFEPLPLDSVLTFIPETGIDREILSSFTVSSENVQYSVSLINPKGTMMEVATPVISLRSAGISLTSSLLESIPNQRAFISDGGSQVVNDAAVANYFEITTNVLLDGRQLTIDLTYDPTLFDFPEAQLQIARFDAQSGRWHRIVTTMDTVANTASFTTNKTSLFVLADSTDAVLSAAPSFPMPVELATLDAGQGQDGNIQLEWSTASESNNFGFYIERSIDGITWQEIGFVEGHGTTEVAHQYTFGDADAIAHTQYQYRLRQVDYNGAVTLSQEVSVMTSLPTQFALEQNYPNPFNPATHIRFTLAHVGHVALRVYDVTGRLVQTLVNESRQAGEFHETWDGKTSVGLAAATGVYFYRLETVSQVATRTMLLVR